MENNLSELESLRELLKMKEVYPDYEMVGARIISKEAGNWYHSFIIDKGSNDGIKKDMNVIYDNGLAGIVTDVSATNATVRAIIDDTSSVSGMLSKSTELCIVNGDLKLYQEGLLDVEMIAKDAQVTAGDELSLPTSVINIFRDWSSDISAMFRWTAQISRRMQKSHQRSALTILPALWSSPS